MRTKALLGLAALAAGVVTCAAQNVYSLNVVGYYNVTVPAGKFALLGNQLVQTDQTVGTLLAGVPGGTSVLTWSGTSFLANNFDASFGWDDPSVALSNGNGFFIKNTSASPLTLTFVGEVNQNTNTINFTSGAFSLVSLFTPQAGLLQTDFGYPPSGGDSVLTWNGNAYTGVGYDASFGWDAEPQLAVGDGFFVKAGATKAWTRSFKVP